VGGWEGGGGLRRVQGSIPLCDAKLLSISTTFRARGKTGGTYYAVTIGAINKNGTYSIDFDDGDKI
jgi:hypothetical protein